MKNLAIIISLLLICIISIYFIAADDTKYNIKLHDEITPIKIQTDENVKNEDEIEDWPDDCEEDYDESFEEYDFRENIIYEEDSQDNFEYNGYEANYEYEYNLPTYSDFRADPRR